MARTRRTGQAAWSLPRLRERQEVQAPVRAAHRKACRARLEEMFTTSSCLAELSEHLTGLGSRTETSAQSQLVEEVLPRQVK